VKSTRTRVARRHPQSLRIASRLAAVLLAGVCAAAAHAEDDGAPMRGLYGPYSMLREASGSSWQPDSSAMEALHVTWGPWRVMVHGDLAGVYTDQSGPRGGSELFNESNAMIVASRAVGADIASVRVMGSLEPLDGPSGYPLLFQTGAPCAPNANCYPLIDQNGLHLPSALQNYRAPATVTSPPVMVPAAR
jgi:hypothetical protein